MCITIHEAILSETLVFAQVCSDGDHMLGYQNTAKNISSSSVNAMLLPIPAKDKLEPENMINTKDMPNILRDMEKVAFQEERSLSRGIGPASKGISKSFRIFQSGMYTVVLAKSVTALKLAVKNLPKDFQIKISNEQYAAYKKWYPKFQFALCLWKDISAIKAHPILWKFKSMYEKLFYPALDGHGGIPKLYDQVNRDHVLMVGSEKYGNIINYTDGKKLSYLPSRVMGFKPNHKTMNGDWWLDPSLLSGNNEYSAWDNLAFELKVPPGGLQDLK